MWDAVGSVVAGAAVGVVTNLVTGQFDWGLAAGLVALVGLLAGSAYLRVRDERETARQARDRVLSPLASAPPPGPGAGAVPWLAPVFTPTRLWGRDAERRALVGWCLDGDRADLVRVVCGQAGVGKTRLAVEVARALPGGWFAGQAVGVVGVAEAVAACGDPALVVVDDADLVPDLPALVRGLAAVPGRVRLLLLTRDPDLPRRLRLPDPLRPALAREPLRLGPVGGGQDRARWFEEATRGYAKALGVPPPAVPRLPVGDDGDDGDAMLLLHARALLAALDRTGTRAHSWEELVERLLDLEAQRWADDPDAPARGGRGALAEVVAALVLFPAATAGEAADVLRRLPRYAHDAAGESRAALADWARRRFPPTPDGRLDLRPHLVAERLAVTTARRVPALLAAPEGIGAAVAVLARALATYPDALPPLVDALGGHADRLPALLVPVLAHAPRDPAVDRALAELVAAADPAHRDDLCAPRVPDRFPRTRCAQSLLAVARAREQGSTADLARALSDHGADLALTGRRQDALTDLREAVALWRDLGAEHRFELAVVLGNAGAAHSGLGHHQDALTTRSQAVAIWRELVGEDPERHRSDLAWGLNHLGGALGRLGRDGEALVVYEEVVALWRGLAAEDARHLPDLAFALTNLGAALSGVGSPREALPPREEALALRRDLAARDPDRHRPDLATALGDLGTVLMRVKRHRDALPMLEQALALWRELVGRGPDHHRDDLAKTLTLLGIALQEMGRKEEALTPQREALTRWRELAAREPGRHREDLAMGLNNLGATLNDLRRHDEALPLLEESLRLRRDLAAEDPDLHRPRLGSVLNNLGASLSGLGRPHEAVEVELEALAVHREAARRSPGPHLPDVATALVNLSVDHQRTDDVEAAARDLREAAAIWKELAERDPALYGPAHSATLGRLRDLLGADQAVTHDL